MPDASGIKFINPIDLSPETIKRLEQQTKDASTIITAWIAHRVTCSDGRNKPSRWYDLCDSEVGILKMLDADPGLQASVLIYAIHLLTQEYKERATDGI